MGFAGPVNQAFYGAVNPSILGGFDWEEDEDQGSSSRAAPNPPPPPPPPPPEPASTHTALSRAAPNPPPPPEPASTHTALFTAGGYWSFNLSLLDDFEDDDAAVGGGKGLAKDAGKGTSSQTAPRSLPVAPPVIQATVRREEVGTTGTAGAQSSTSTAIPKPPNPTRWPQILRPTTTTKPPSPSPGAPNRSNNPYATAIENKQNAMTVAFLRTAPSNASAEKKPSPIATDDLGFGQRYTVAESTSSVVITNQRRLPDLLSGDRECIVCTDTKPVYEFPATTITKTCTHDPTTCNVCVAASIRVDLNHRLWNEIRCPECRETLEYDDVQRFADDETKERYQTLSFRTAISSSPNFIWCTSGCGYGQVHESGLAQPIVTCRLCAHRSCFHHRVAWHENLTCGEYDSLNADPDNFRSRFEVENEAAERAAEARRAQEDADRVFAQGLVAAEKRAVEEEREEKERRRRREAERERERKEKENRARKDREMREAAVRRKKEEEASARTVKSVTKPCPGCKAPIQKNDGCAHMTCTWCNHAFCWDCLADHKAILEKDNSAHKQECPWHPDNIKD
ncbi:hypothetical protein C8A05DRAFT_13984 [Staphylotrichum tortipilum]|uniref:RBR-type E3 ubiquitin transferase n=1 Tax=Staphylotrichum tortipilum TaxID=2831512 RepID=A0AAN6MNC8_9PEZI|nr:hypothetical protein C8A05DRAFT_13984 [Staphylotrichum longicolle]